MPSGRSEQLCDDDRPGRARRTIGPCGSRHYHTAGGSGWGRTSGDVGHSDPRENIRGQPIDVRDGVVRCLYCHVTRSRDFRDPPPEGRPRPGGRRPGIGCERCHGPGGNHVAAIKDDSRTGRSSTPAHRPRRSTASAPTATSSGSPSRDQKVRPTNPQYVRSPGVTMTFSRATPRATAA